MIEFPHKAPKNYSYEFEEFNSRTIRIIIWCHLKFGYDLDKPAKSVWGFYNPKKKEYYAPINFKTIGKVVDINDTRPYSAMQIKKQGVEKFFV